MRSPNPIILPDSETEGDSLGESMWKGGRFGVDAGSSLFWREGGNDGNALDGSIFAGHGYGRESVDSMMFLVCGARGIVAEARPVPGTAHGHAGLVAS